MKLFFPLIVIFLMLFTISVYATKQNVSHLVNQYQKLITREHQTRKTNAKLVDLREELTPLIEDALRLLETKVFLDKDSCDDTDNSSTDEDSDDYDDLSSSNEDLYASLLQFLDEPDYFSPEEQCTILDELVHQRTISSDEDCY